MQPAPPCPAPACQWRVQASALLLRWGSFHWARNLSVLIIYLFIFPPSYIALCGSKAHTDSAVRVFPGVWKLLSFKTPFPGQSSIPTSFASLFVFYIFSYLLLKTIGCFSGFLMSSAGIQKFCVIYSSFKCSFDEFVGEKVVSPSYSSAILGPPPPNIRYSLQEDQQPSLEICYMSST